MIVINIIKTLYFKIILGECIIVPQSNVISAINEDKEEDSIAGSAKEKCEEKKVNARGEEE